MNDFNEMMLSILWNTCIFDGNIHETWDRFRDLFLSAIKCVVPEIKIKGKRKVPWISPEIIKLVQSKNRLYINVLCAINTIAGNGISTKHAETTTGN